MCGRYALALRPSEVRQQLEQAQMPVHETPGDDEVRQSYNFAPGYHGLVYRADGPGDGGAEGAVTYKLQAMQWGLVPFWTKRNPDYGSKLKTINCRDDSLAHDGGMWASMKKTKRCIIVAQGFYEWLKKGSQKMPHFTRRKDGQLMCLAGLWDAVQFEHAGERLYTYSIITTDANKQLSFLHDRMPVILDNGSDALRTWLDPARSDWSNDLQALLQPYHGELECYPVSKDVGKVGNNSPTFLVPIDSAENKNNIANFFGNQRNAAKPSADEHTPAKAEHGLTDSSPRAGTAKIEHDVDETRATTNRVQGTEDNAPLPVPATPKGIKREHSEPEHDGRTAAAQPPEKMRRTASPATKASLSPAKTPAKKRGTRSATSNGSAAKTAKADGSQKITSFFSNK